MYRIGYIDEDKGWLNTFYQYLKDDFEIVLFDLTEETEIDNLVEDVFNNAIDLLVLDFRLDETGVVDFNADSLVEKIQERNLYYPLIVLTSHESDALDHLPDAHIVNGKDMLESDNSKIEILKHKISKVASDYKTKLIDSEGHLATLEDKRVTVGLEPDEEDKYVELNNFLDKTTAAKGHLSRTFYSVDTNNKLDKLIQKTEELLNKISPKR